MPVRVAINGLSRIGRSVLRIGLREPDIRFVGINDAAKPRQLAYAVQLDSNHGRFHGKV